LVKIIAEKAKYAALRVIRIHSTSWPRSIHLNGLPSFGASSFGHIKRRLPRIHLHGIQASESKLQAAESKPAPASSNLHASFVTSISTESKHQPPCQSVASTSTGSKHRISVTSILHASPTSHSPPRNPSFAFQPLQPSIHVQLAAFDALEEPSPSCCTRLLRTMVANESTRAHRFVANEM